LGARGSTAAALRRAGAGRPGIPDGEPAVEVADLRKTYGTLVAVDGISFTVAEGEINLILQARP